MFTCFTCLLLINKYIQQICNSSVFEEQAEGNLHNSNQGSLQSEVQGVLRGVSRCRAHYWWRHYQPICIMSYYDYRGKSLFFMFSYTHFWILIKQILTIPRRKYLCELLELKLIYLCLLDSAEYVIQRLWNNEGGWMGCIWRDPLHEGQGERSGVGR